ncbi:transcriptional regulator, PadR-like family [Segniliparus rotundus DSM 44985]|uniref:Transcriptional regulator, PadR-like family n=1 Tax=Segniliparus rotundus (strain ATCC BAA-972 / CDC 1076 / CIP 108378 / DSM 44985 / JCM 13578) TaxID=640132 RepID=D6ZB90_SEGRD|nr:PadR family transcriptional regulator [Segniliparus rotundus]ADG96849.1 transcriptional regulator, PadR-like family [Segniliparus rotundus DSM 44985]
MALEHALLVSLAERPSTGYDLARRFDKSISFFWSASHQQIYRTLQRIVAAEWATCEVVRQNGKPDKKVYSISEEGKAELAKWVNKPSSGPILRWELPVKLRGLAHGDPDVLVKDLRAHREQAVRTLAHYRDSEARHFPAAPLTGAPLYQRLVLEAGIRQAEALIAWLDEAAAALEPHSPQPSEDAI